jgi:hypothetical protein
MEGYMVEKKKEINKKNEENTKFLESEIAKYKR